MAAPDTATFEQLVEQHRRPLHAHCYRMLGSLQDAEDALQETLLAAWRGLDRFEGRSSVRTWLYRIATNACLRLAERRPQRVLASDLGLPWTDIHELGEYLERDPRWLDPYPPDVDPAAAYQQRENVELAFVAALQALPANQRAVLILREVLEFSAAEVAGTLDTTVASVNSALQRARKTVDRRLVAGPQADELRALGERGRDELVTAFVSAWDRADVDGLLELLAEDASFTMPPFAAWFRGRADIGRFLSGRVFRSDRRTLPAEASGQLATACYRRDPESGRYLLDALNVLTVRDGRIAAMHAFLDPATHRWFDLPAALPEENPASER